MLGVPCSRACRLVVVIAAFCWPPALPLVPGLSSTLKLGRERERIICADIGLSGEQGPSARITPRGVSSRANDLDILDELLKNYDRRALPSSHLGNATIVSCEIYIRSFGSINPSNMDYEVDLYFRQSWLDERLRKSTLSRPLDLNDPKLVQMIWKPEVFFANAKHAEFQYVTVPNVLVRINPTGIILYMLR
ncbi:hypothetical protein HPB52_001430 [Rhipicephalus sanguineus]|uniref:Neurotransmitter-gated ion-channel ligand-binding domain-containing protein n=1 Tax=Rhipicephalus sanguineus TaxID=34632 RepID=A0A9D4PP74_RHISA|nr:hypothetical protein HPB52_001430 [Rhipicephalus sanguineus]